MLPAIPSAINAGARGSAGGQASILESDDFGHRSAPRGVLPSLLPVDSRVSSTSEKVTLPPKTPPGGYSLQFNKARSVEARINDPLCDFMSNAGYNMSAAELGKLKWQLRQQPSAKALKNTQNANTKALQSSDPAFTDDTVRGVLNFLLRTKYYEESPDYQVNPVTVKKSPQVIKQTMWGEDKDYTPPFSHPPTPPAPRTPKQLLPPRPLAQPLSRASTGLTTDFEPPVSPNTPELYKATNWAPHRQPLRVASSTSGSKRRGGVSSGPVSEQDFGEVEHQGDDDDEVFAKETEREGAFKGDNDDNSGEEFVNEAKRVQDSWKGQRYMFHVRQLCVEHVIRHMDAVNAIPMLRFAEEANSHLIKEKALSIILNDFESALAAGEFTSLHFRHAKEILGHPRLRVQTEEKVCDAALGWLETHHYDRIMAELELRDDLVEKLESITLPVDDLNLNLDTLRQDVAALQQQVFDQQARVHACIQYAEKCEAQLKDHTEELVYNDHLLLQSARELGTYRPEDLLLCLYRNPNDAVQMLLEALALMFGMEPNWLSTRRMCFEGQMVQLMAQYDFKKIKPADIALVYEYTKRPKIKVSKFKTKAMVAVATWVHAASACVRLVSEMLGDDVGIKEAKQVVLDEQAVLESLKRDLDVLANEEHNSQYRLRLALGAQLCARLEYDLCISRLIRDSRTMHREARELLSCIRWPLVSKHFLISKVDSNVFIQKFIHTDKLLDDILVAAQHVPDSEFYKAAFSCTDKLILSPGESIYGVSDVSGALGRRVYGASLKSEALMLSKSVRLSSLSSLPGQGLTSRLGWKRLCQFPEAKGGKGEGWPKELSVTSEGTPGAVGTSSLGSVVAVSGDWMLVAGGLDKLGRPHNQVLKVKLSAYPRTRPIWQSDWEHCAFMLTPRAFANGGVLPARARDHAGVDSGLTNTCLVMCGGYNNEGLYLRSAEVAQTPIADCFFPIPSLTYTRVLGCVAEASQWGKRKVVLVGGFDENGDAAACVESLPINLSFDAIGELTFSDLY